MAIKFIPVVLFALTLAFSCTESAEDDVQITQDEDQTTEDSTSKVDSTFQACDSVFVATFPGTACCVSGPTRANPGEIATYHYQINHKEPRQWSWEIREGDITIIKGQDMHTVTVQFGPNFTTGIIACLGSGLKDGIRNSCADRCIIQKRL